MLAIVPLSLGPVAGLTVAGPPFATDAVLYVSVGAAFADTLTVRLAVDVALPESVTVKTTVFAPVVALQTAATVAVIVPAVFVIPITVMPAGTVVAVTVSVPAASSASLTIAMVDTVPALPCCLAIGAAAVMFGGVLASLEGEP